MNGPESFNSATPERNGDLMPEASTSVKEALEKMHKMLERKKPGVLRGRDVELLTYGVIRPRRAIPSLQQVVPSPVAPQRARSEPKEQPEVKPIHTIGKDGQVHFEWERVEGEAI